MKGIRNQKKALALLAWMAAASVAAQEVCLEEDFTWGIPDDFTLICYDQMPVKGQDFKKGSPRMTWFKTASGSADGASAFSTSRRAYDLPTDNWMITPKLTLPADGAWLKWTAKSVHYHLRDGYRVMVSTAGTEYEDFTELYQVEAEEYLWTKHVASLEAYAGKEVYIAFVHDSQNKFMIAIDDIFVGQMSEADFIVKDNTRRFVGNVETVTVEGQACNSGVALDSRTLKCVVNGTDTITLADGTEAAWLTGEVRDFHFDVPAEVGKAVHYKLLADGEHTVLEDSVICSHFPRTLFLEKATGAWCVNCPEVIPYIQELEERYGEEIVCVEAHAHYGDLFEYMPYASGMKTNSFPTVHFNRDRENAIYSANAQSRAVLKKIINKPTIAKVDLALNYEGGDSIEMTSRVTFAHTTDNSTGKYRIGYALIEKEVQTDRMRQSNGAAMEAYHGEFYYINSPVPADLMWYANVVRGMESAFIGVKNSLPATIEGGVEYTIADRIGIPETIYNKEKLAVVAIVMNYYTDEVLNVAEVKVPVDASRVQSPLMPDVDNGSPLRVEADGRLTVDCPDEAPFVVEVCAADGRRVQMLDGSGRAEFDLTGKLSRGIWLVRLTQADRVWTKKIIKE